MKKQVIMLVSVLLYSSMSFAQGDFHIENAWVRATVAQQSATGMFLQIVADVDAALVGVETPAAARAEVHEMKMDDGVMKMRAIERLSLPAGQQVVLKPGGYHIMLFDLKEQAKEGNYLAVSLIVEKATGERETLALSVPIRPLAAKNAMAKGQ